MIPKFQGVDVKEFFMGMKERNVAGTTEQLQQAHVIIAGAGGLGSNIAIALTRSGVGHLTIIDFDTIEMSNLNRQQYKVSQIGLPKVTALKQNLLEFNPFIEIDTVQTKITSENIAELFADADIICEAFDNPTAKAMLLEGATKHYPDKPLVMGNGMAGLHLTNEIQTKQPLPNVYICGDGYSKGMEGLMALRRTNTQEENILNYIPDDVTILPNTSGSTNAQEAIRMARIARELSGSDFIKLEVVPDKTYLLPDNEETIKATQVLADEGFIVLPYTLPDLNAARKLVAAGAAAVMPLGAPIGTNRGLATKDLIQILIDEIDVPIIVDAGIGRPSQAAEAMEMGAAAVMANTAMATAGDIPLMSEAFKLAVEAGRKGYLAQPGRVLDKKAAASSPILGISK